MHELISIIIFRRPSRPLTPRTGTLVGGRAASAAPRLATRDTLCVGATLGRAFGATRRWPHGAAFTGETVFLPRWICSLWRKWAPIERKISSGGD